MQLDRLALEADLLRVLGHPARLHLIQILGRNETCVCDLIPQVGLEQSNLSQHLKLLRKHGIVDSRREGTRVVYRLSNRSVLLLVQVASEAVQEHLDRFSAMAENRR